MGNRSSTPVVSPSRRQRSASPTNQKKSSPVVRFGKNQVHQIAASSSAAPLGRDKATGRFVKKTAADAASSSPVRTRRCRHLESSITVTEKRRTRSPKAVSNPVAAATSRRSRSRSPEVAVTTATTRRSRSRSPVMIPQQQQVETPSLPPQVTSTEPATRRTRRAKSPSSVENPVQVEEVPKVAASPSRQRSVSPPPAPLMKSSWTNVEMSKRDYATPSLATATVSADISEKKIAPATLRKTRKMTSEKPSVVLPPTSTSSSSSLQAKSPQDLLWNYLNAA